MSTQKPGAPEVMDPAKVDMVEAAEVKQWNSQEAGRFAYNSTNPDERDRRKRLVQSTYPWLAWNDRPFVSQDEIMQVPAADSSLMLRQYSTINQEYTDSVQWHRTKDDAQSRDGDRIDVAAASPPNNRRSGTAEFLYDGFAPPRFRHQR